MLHRPTVEDRTFNLYVELSEDERLIDFFLVGGTALALQLGHRKSIDLDLFTLTPFDSSSLLEYLSSTYKQYLIEPIVQFPNTLMAKMDGIKVDFIQHDYPLLHPLVQHGALRLASIDDITAMKVNAIVQSGKRMKDFVDMLEIAHHRTIDQVIQAYTQKYPNGIPASFARKAVSYFADVEEAERPVMMRGNLDWQRTQKLLVSFTNGEDLRQKPDY